MSCQAKQSVIIPVLLVFLIFVIVICITLPLVFSINGTQDESKQRTVYTDGLRNLVYTNSWDALKSDISLSIDNQTDPCENFYQFACGRWGIEHHVPQDLPYWHNFYERNRVTRKKLKSIFDDKIDKSATIKYERIVKEVYQSCSAKSTNKTSINWIRAYVEQHFGGWLAKGQTLTKSPLTILINAHRLGNQPFFTFNIEPKNKVIRFNSFSEHTSYTYQKLYTNCGEQSPCPYKEFIRESVLLVFPELRKNDELFDQIISHESGPDFMFSDIYNFDDLDYDLSFDYSHYSNEDASFYGQNESDFELKLYSLESFNQAYAIDGLNWTDFFAYFIRQPIDNYQIATDGLNKPLYDLVMKYKNDPYELINYAIWRSIEQKIYLLTQFEEVRSIFKRFYKSGTIYIESLDKQHWEFCVEYVDSMFSPIVRRLFVQNYFDTSAKGEISEIFKSIQTVASSMISSQEWLDAPEKRSIIRTIKNMNIGVGDIFPGRDDRFFRKQLKYLDISNKSFFQKIDAITWNGIMQSIHHSNTKEAWKSLPTLAISPFYDAALNKAIFPAGSLQFPLYDPGFPAQVKFGGLAMVIAHEVLHALDQVVDWCDPTDTNYTKACIRNQKTNHLLDYHDYQYKWHSSGTGYIDPDKYKNRMQCLVDTYNKATYFGYPVDGRATFIENICDHGALNIAWDSWKIAEKKSLLLNHPSSNDDYSEDQYFFLSLANNFCGSANFANCTSQGCNGPVHPLLKRQLSDTHSPDSVRVNELFKQFTPFSKVWECAPKSNMVEEDACVVW